MRDSRETFTIRAFVAGFPVHHSRSPLIHTHWLKTYQIDGSYIHQEMSPQDFLHFLADVKNRVKPFAGGNITIPHKEAAFRLCDEPDEIARELGAVNTIWWEDGLLKATNTDGFGFVANLDEQRKGWDKGKTALILGAGGASRAIVQAVRDRGFQTIHIVNRTLEKAQELADRFGNKVQAHSLQALKELLPDTNLFVNTTSLGMNGQPAPEIDFSVMPEKAVVTDIVYVPLITPILAQAQAQGLATVDGLGMLLHQAVPGFEKWFGQRPKVDSALRQKIIDDLDQKK